MSKNDAVEDLQTRLAFQEDMLGELNSRVAEQDKHIEILQKQLQHLHRKIQELQNDENGGEDDGPPPHY